MRSFFESKNYGFIECEILQPVINDTTACKCIDLPTEQSLNAPNLKTRVLHNYQIKINDDIFYLEDAIVDMANYYGSNINILLTDDYGFCDSITVDNTPISLKGDRSVNKSSSGDNKIHFHLSLDESVGIYYKGSGDADDFKINCSESPFSWTGMSTWMANAWFYFNHGRRTRHLCGPDAFFAGLNFLDLRIGFASDSTLVVLETQTSSGGGTCSYLESNDTLVWIESESGFGLNLDIGLGVVFGNHGDAFGKFQIVRTTAINEYNTMGIGYWPFLIPIPTVSAGAGLDFGRYYFDGRI